MALDSHTPTFSSQSRLQGPMFHLRWSINFLSFSLISQLIKTKKIESKIIQSSSSSSPPSSHRHQLWRHSPSSSPRSAVIVCQLCHRCSLALRKSLSAPSKSVMTVSLSSIVDDLPQLRRCWSAIDDLPQLWRRQSLSVLLYLIMVIIKVYHIHSLLRLIIWKKKIFSNHFGRFSIRLVMLFTK